MNLSKVLMLLIVMITANCSKIEEVEEDNNQNCELTHLERLHQEWELSVIVWEESLINKEDCIVNRCPYFNLTFNDSTYQLSYFLIRESTNNVIDSIKHEEIGEFEYEYCHRTNLNEQGGHYPGGYTNTGSINFSPTIGNSYSSSFQLDLNVDLKISIEIEEKIREIYLVEN